MVLWHTLSFQLWKIFLGTKISTHLSRLGVSSGWKDAQYLENQTNKQIKKSVIKKWEISTLLNYRPLDKDNVRYCNAHRGTNCGHNTDNLPCLASHWMIYWLHVGRSQLISNQGSRPVKRSGTTTVCLNRHRTSPAGVRWDQVNMTSADTEDMLGFMSVQCGAALHEIIHSGTSQSLVSYALVSGDPSTHCQTALFVWPTSVRPIQTCIPRETTNSCVWRRHSNQLLSIDDSSITLFTQSLYCVDFNQPINQSMTTPF